MPTPPPPPDQLYVLNPGPPVWVKMVGLVAWYVFIMLVVYAFLNR